MSDNPYVKNTLAPLFLIFFFVLNIQFIKILPIGDVGSSLRFYHLFAMCCIPLFFKGIYKIKINTVVIYFVISFFTSFLAAYRFGLNGYYLQLYSIPYFYIMGISFANLIGQERILILIKKVIFLMNILVLLKIIYYWGVDFYSSGEDILFFYSGGPNIEATWINLFSIFFLFEKRFYFYSCVGLLISIAYSSRTSFVIWFLIVIIWAFHKLKRKKVIFFSCLSAFIILIGVFFYKYSSSIYLLSRFNDVGDYGDGSFSRLVLFNYGAMALEENLFGYGPGNAFRQASEIAGQSFKENNFHNIYLQTLLDNGIQSFIIFIVIVIGVFKKEFDFSFKSPLGVFILLYLLSGVSQFTGYEIIFWFMFGIYSIRNNANMAKKIIL